MITLSSMILAGGRSRRMGTDKALLTLPNGQPLLSRTAQIAQRLTSEVIVMTPWPERYDAILSPPVQLIKELPHQRGPLSAFAQGWAHVRTDWCLVLACDLPQLESEPLRRWWAWVQTQIAREDSALDMTSDAIASLTRSSQPSADEQNPTHKQKNKSDRKLWEPLCGFYHRSCLPSLHHRLDTAASAHSRLSFQSWLKPLPVLAYDSISPSMLLNCNTPEEWAAFRD